MRQATPLLLREYRDSVLPLLSANPKATAVLARPESRSLQVPGEMTIENRSYKAQEEVTASYGDESWGTGSYMDVRRTAWSLKTGAKKRERSSWAGEYVGGHDFSIYEPKEDEKAEQVRDRLVAEKRQQLKNEFDHAKKINPPSPDARLYNLDSEEWTKRYDARWDEMQKAIEDQWESEDAQFLAEAKQSWEQREGAAKDLREARQEAADADNLARISHIGIENITRPDGGNIGTDTAEQMQEKAVALRAYASEINVYIPKALTDRKEEMRNMDVAREEEEKQRKAKEESEIEQFGASGRLLDVARSLAAEAEQKLGSTNAQTLFEATYGARYGRAGRQGDIKEALGEDISEESRSFYNFSRASDVNIVLGSVLKIFGGADEHSKPADSLPALSEIESVSPKEIKIEELPRLEVLDKKGWWAHELPNGIKHSDKLNRTDKTAYDAGERINVRCPSCPDNPLVGYLKK